MDLQVEDESGVRLFTLGKLFFLAFISITFILVSYLLLKHSKKIQARKTKRTARYNLIVHKMKKMNRVQDDPIYSDEAIAAISDLQDVGDIEVNENMYTKAIANQLEMHWKVENTWKQMLKGKHVVEDRNEIKGSLGGGKAGDEKQKSLGGLGDQQSESDEFEIGELETKKEVKKGKGKSKASKSKNDNLLKIDFGTNNGGGSRKNGSLNGGASSYMSSSWEDDWSYSDSESDSESDIEVQ